MMNYDYLGHLWPFKGLESLRTGGHQHGGACHGHAAEARRQPDAPGRPEAGRQRQAEDVEAQGPGEVPVDRVPRRSNGWFHMIFFMILCFQYFSWISSFLLMSLVCFPCLSHFF